MTVPVPLAPLSDLSGCQVRRSWSARWRLSLMFCVTMLAVGVSYAAADVQPAHDIEQIEAGASFSCLLDAQGEVKCWGVNSIGQLATGELGDVSGERRIPLPRTVEGLETPVRQLTLGAAHACALSGTGTVACWGANGNGQLGDGTITGSPFTGSPVPLTIQGLPADIESISAGDRHTCALSAAGGVYCWGRNHIGQVGDGSLLDRGTPVVVSGLASDVVEIQAATAFTCALTDAGAVKCWGSRLGDGTANSSAVPVDATGFDGPVVHLATGDNHACAVTATRTWCWGDNSAGQLGTGAATEAAALSPVAVVELDAPPRAITIGNGYTCVIDVEDFVRCWGLNNYGQLGNGVATPLAEAPDRSDLSERLGRIRALSAGTFHVCAVGVSGAAYCWGSNTTSALGDGTFADHALPVPVLARPDNAVSVAAGYGHTCALADGSVSCWGLNTFGQLGDGSTERRVGAVSVTGLPAGVQSISAGGTSTCALTGTGGVYCWGQNQRGQLGDGTAELRNAPVQVSGLGSGVQSITVGAVHACALLQDGAIKCWGANTYGSLGNGADQDAWSPVEVIGLGGQTIASLSAGFHVTCATTLSGAAWCWGRNDMGQLGDGTQTSRPTPALVHGLASGVRSVHPSVPTHTCAVTTAGGVKCWGQDQYGQLGLPNPTTLSLVPADVPGLASGVARLATGYGMNCVILQSAGVRCWGALVWGVLGYDNTRRPTVVDQPALAGTTALSIGSRHACRIDAEGRVACWGYKGDGEIGDGTTAYKPVPVNVMDTVPAPGVYLIIERGDAAPVVSKGTSGTRSYRIRATNYGIDDVRGVRLRVPVPDGLANVTWNCGITSVPCMPASGNGAVDLVVDLAPEQSVLMHLVGNVASDATFVRIDAQLQLPSGVIVSNPQGDQAVHIEAVGLGVFGSGFE